MKKFEFTSDFEGHKKGDKMDYDKTIYCGYQHPLIMRGILECISKIKDKEELNMDLNNDGVVDAKDVTIAAKVLARSRKIRKKVN